ncbi:MAG TPA: hypothetical protein VLB44_23085, partial [Kofleriaceae bacterium]|nr:hypothetical protein [Kofleriaceae bacterium]
DRPACVHPELTELMTRAPGSDVVAKFQAATATPGCTPFQGPFRLVDPEAPMRAARALLADATRREDVVEALDEVAAGIRACQDLGRGPAEILVSMRSSACERLLIDVAGTWIATRALTPVQVQHAAATFAALAETEPRFGETIVGQLQTMSTHRAIVFQQARDEAALTIASDEIIGDLIVTTCPPTASLESCARELSAAGEIEGDPPKLLAQRQDDIRKARTDDARHALQTELATTAAHHYLRRLGVYIARRAVTVTQLASVRIQLQVLRDGRCPRPDELAAPPYAALRAPAVLGDAIVVTRTENVLTVEPPVWARSDKPAPIRIKCP